MPWTSGTPTDAVALFQQDGVRWLNMTKYREREAWVADLEARLPDALAAEDAAELVAILRAAAASLAGPRARPHRQDGGAPMDMAAEAWLQQALQRRLRRLVIRVCMYALRRMIVRDSHLGDHMSTTIARSPFHSSTQKIVGSIEESLAQCYTLSGALKKSFVLFWVGGVFSWGPKWGPWAPLGPIGSATCFS